MVKMGRSVLCQIGIEFFEFLKESNRESITDRIELRDIYNAEFRSRRVVVLHVGGPGRMFDPHWTLNASMCLCSL